MMPDLEIPVVSVIVPARNEEACLGLCLESLTTQTGIAFEVIVVDDASTDRTAEIAKSFADGRAAAALVCLELSAPQGRASLAQDGSPGLRPPPRSSPGGTTKLSGNSVTCHLTVISAPPLPGNWTGKNNAMSAGAKIAKGKWLLFTDADTVHKPGSLARAVAEAEEHGVALLSYSPEQEVRTLLEKAVMPVIFAQLAATYPPSKVRDPSSPIAAANGQYLMISRQAYDAVGGHSKIAADLLEDVAMARLVKSSGRQIWFRYGGDAVRTRMYRTWPQMKEGWTKNLALLFPHPSELAWARISEFLLFILAPLSVLRGGYWKAFLKRSNPTIIRWYYLLLGALVCMAFVWWSVRYILRMRRSNDRWSSVVFGLLGLPLFAYLLFRSHQAYKNARFDWKDRSYVYSADEVRNMTHRA